MKIGIYARGLSNKAGGTKEYIKLMTRALIEEIDEYDQLYIFHNLDKEIFIGKKDNVKEILLKSKNNIICDFLLSPLKINRLNLDVIWFPKNVIPYFVNAKKIVTIHDLNAYFLKATEYYNFVERLYRRITIKSSCKRANRIIAVTNNTKEDVIKILKIDPKKINVIYEAIDTRYKIIKNKKQLKRVRTKYNLPEKFVLHTGRIVPLKNVLGLIKAFNKLSVKEKNIHLVLTGYFEWYGSIKLDYIKSDSKIQKIGFVEDEDMPYLYNLAELYAYPSFYEGFGLPILEAQACGCPVIASNTSSIPEVGRDGVHYINPNNIKEIKEGIVKILNDNNYRNTLINKGLKNVERFSLKKSADNILKCIKSVFYKEQ